MESNQGFPFEVGQQAESKSFQTGFRGAWFRCKIKGMRKMKGHLNYILEFFDFPDEKDRHTQLYQKPNSKEETKFHLMVRPSYPSVYCESEISDTSTTSEVTVIVNQLWKVGDLVDWWSDDCYWSGRIVHILDEDRVEIKLHPPPVGEGKTYEAFRKDLRPSLNWSPKGGWTVPEASHPCARIVEPTNQDQSTTMGVSSESKQLADCVVKEETRTTKLLGWEEDKIEMPKPSLSDSVSSTRTTRVGMAASERDYLYSSYSDTIDSYILDLEELVTKIEWIKKGHQFGFEFASGITSSWQFLEG